MESKLGPVTLICHEVSFSPGVQPMVAASKVTELVVTLVGTKQGCSMVVMGSNTQSLPQAARTPMTYAVPSARFEKV